jgi:hypothetical protein
MALPFFLCAVLLGGLGAAIRFKKASFFIAGFNTASKKEKEKYDEEALCAFVGNLLFTLAVIQLGMGLARAFGMPYFSYILGAGFGLFVAVTIGAVIYMNTGGRFLK